MAFVIPDSATEYGFRQKPGGAHSSKTMMLPELRLLLAASTPGTEFAELRRLALEENVLLKDTLSNRGEVFRRLADLYGLRQELPLYRALRLLWQAGDQEQPLLALLCALARDTFLRATTSVVLNQPVGAVVAPALIAGAIEAAYPERYNPKTKLSMSQNVAASWAQSGHLAGKLSKVRTRVSASPAAAAYALLLGHLCGVRGPFLLETEWASVLDAEPGQLDRLAVAASQRGWIDYRRMGNVVEISFSHLLGA